MKPLEKGQEKIQKICTLIKEETLEPAKKEAEEIINHAKHEAEQILILAEKNAAMLRSAALAEIEKERAIFYSSLEQAARQSLETLRGMVEKKFFNEQLQAIIEKTPPNLELIGKLIETIVRALEKEGLAANLTVFVPESLSAQDVNRVLLENTLKLLKDGSVVLGGFANGIQVRLHDKKMMIDISDAALIELISKYPIYKDFRKMLFADQSVG